MTQALRTTINPIGIADAKFNGTFDGKGHKVKGVRITVSGVRNTGLFGTIGDNGTVKNLCAEDFIIRGTTSESIISSGIGAFVGNLLGTISGCSAVNCKISGFKFIGGICGAETSPYTSITDCTVMGCEITADNSYAGGIIGVNNGPLRGCTVTDSVITTTGNGAGGIAGDNDRGITDCRTAGCTVKNNAMETFYGTITGESGSSASVGSCIYQNDNPLIKGVGANVDNGQYVGSDEGCERVYAVHCGAGVTAAYVSGETETIGGVTYYKAGAVLNLTCSEQEGYTSGTLSVKDMAGNAVALNGSQLTLPAGDVEAKLEAIRYTLSYDLVGGTGDNPKSYTIESEDFTLNNPTRDGCSFTGWTGSNGTTPQTSVKIEQGSTGAKNYTAHWKAIAYTISYDLGGGTLPEGYKVSYDIGSGTFTLPKPTRDGYEFVGWTLSGDNEPASTDLKVPSGTTGDREYVAHWDIIRYTLSYDLAGGTGDNPKTYTIESEDFTLNNPTKAGQRFAGWTGSADVTSSRDVTIPQGSTGNRSYTATWGDYTNTYYVRTPDDLNITTMGWNYPAGIITASADAEDFDPDKKLVITATSSNGWKLKDTSFWGWLNSDTIAYTLKAKQSDTTPTTSWTFTSADLTNPGGTIVTFGAEVEDFSSKRPGVYQADVEFSIEVK